MGLLEIDIQNLQLQLPETIKPLYQEINDHSLHQAQSPESMNSMQGQSLSTHLRLISTSLSKVLEK